MGGEEIAQMHSNGPASANLHNLMPSCMSTRDVHGETGRDFCRPVKQFQISTAPQLDEIFLEIDRFCPRMGMGYVFPLGFLEKMPGIGKSHFHSPGIPYHCHPTGMVKISMGQDHVGYVPAIVPQDLELSGHIPRGGDTIYGFLFAGQFVTETGIDKDKTLRCPHQKRVITQQQCVLVIDGTLFFP